MSDEEEDDVVESDEALARRLQAELENETDRKSSPRATRQVKPQAQQKGRKKSEEEALSDEALARRLQAEFDAENGEGDPKVKQAEVKVKEEAEDVIVLEDSQPLTEDDWRPMEEEEEEEEEDVDSEDDLPTIKPR